MLLCTCVYSAVRPCESIIFRKVVSDAFLRKFNRVLKYLFTSSIQQSTNISIHTSHPKYGLHTCPATFPKSMRALVMAICAAANPAAAFVFRRVPQVGSVRHAQVLVCERATEVAVVALG